MADDGAQGVPNEHGPIRLGHREGCAKKRPASNAQTGQLFQKRISAPMRKPT